MSSIESQVPAGAAVFPVIPEELGIHPMLLGIIQAMVFLAGSEDEVVNSDAATETIDYICASLQRLRGPDLARLRTDMDCLINFARQEKWPKDEVEFLGSFLVDCGVALDQV